jgi:hypothetical protein
MQILDGQNRYLVCKKNNLPVHYTISEGNIHDVINLQISKKWTMNDYLHSYCVSGSKPYLELKDIHFKNPNLPLNNLIKLFGTDNFSFQQGKFNLNNKNIVIKVLDLIKEIDSLFIDKKLSYIFSHHFTSGLRTIVNNPNFNHKLFIKKISNKPYLLKKQPDIFSYTEMFLDIHNKNNRNPINIKGYKQY